MTRPYTDQYYEINQGAHRKPANLIGAPSIIWHQALWNADVNFSGHSDDARRNDRTDAIKSYLWALYDRLVSRGCSPSNIASRDELTPHPGDRSRVFSIEFLWMRLPAIIRFEVHTEYVAITSSVDGSYRPADDVRQTADIDPEFNILYNLFNELSRLDNDDATFNYQLYHNYIYEKIWAKFDAEILQSSTNDVLLTHGSSADAAKAVGGRFADFRGLITVESYDVDIPPDQEGTYGNTSQKPFYDPNLPVDRSRKTIHRFQRFSDDSARHKLSKLWSFLTAVPAPLGSGGRYEYTVSHLIRHRAIYVTALGPQQSGAAGHYREEPLYYLVHSSTQCPRQIGRVIERLNTLGTLRLAALMWIDKFKEAGFLFRTIERDIEDTRTTIFNNLRSTNEGKANSYINEKFDNIEIVLKNIASLFEQEALSYRVARANAYIRNYLQLLSSIDAKRIEGFQPYDTFVLRRLDDSFTFIVGLRERYNEIKESVSSLYQYYLSQSAHAMARSISSSDGEIKKLQEFAEGLLIAFFLPYYFGSILSHIVFPGEPTINIASPGNTAPAKVILLGLFKIPEQTADVAKGLIWVTTVAVCIYLLFYVRASRKKAAAAP